MVHLSSSFLVPLCLLALRVAAAPVQASVEVRVAPNQSLYQRRSPGSTRPSRLSARQTGANSVDTPAGTTFNEDGIPELTIPGGTPTKPPTSDDISNTDPFTMPEPATADGASGPPGSFFDGTGLGDLPGSDPSSGKPTDDQPPDNKADGATAKEKPKKTANGTSGGPQSQDQPDLPKKPDQSIEDAAKTAAANNVVE